MYGEPTSRRMSVARQRSGSVAVRLLQTGRPATRGGLGVNFLSGAHISCADGDGSRASI